ncbi:MAG: HD domain-containing phosphohydrolase [Pseudomonadota bacterium]
MKKSDNAPQTDAVLAALTVATFAMASLAETRDSDTGQHIQRVQHYAKALAQRLQALPQFAAVLTDAYIDMLFKSAPLYDMGTIGIPDRILLKPGRLTPAEFDIMRTHTTLARDAIEHAETSLGYRAELLQTLKEIAYSHQEKWDGSGYPQGLSGTQIPLSARLIALADVYDALISDRVYKAGVPHEQAVGIIFGERGGHFDPDLVDAFMDIQDEFHAIAQRFADTEQDMQKKMEYMANAIAEIAEL